MSHNLYTVSSAVSYYGRMTKSVKTVPAIDLLLPGAKIIKDNLPVFFLLLVVPSLLNQVREPIAMTQESVGLQEMFILLRDSTTLYAWIGSLLTLLLYPALTFAYWKAAKDGGISLGEALTGGMRYFGGLMALFFIMLFLVAGGLVLFIVPGLIALRAFCLAPFYYLDSQGRLGAIGALRKSAKESKKYRWAIYVTIGIFMLFSLVSVFGLPGQILSAILVLLYGPAFALRHREIAR